MELEAKRQLGVPVADPVEPEVKEEPVVEPESVTGHVVADILNVREEPTVDPENILGTERKGAEVIVYTNESVGDFYKVCTAKGLEGFCMKQYIQVD